MMKPENGSAAETYVFAIKDAVIKLPAGKRLDVNSVIR
jgi:hypothetical protein